MNVFEHHWRILLRFWGRLFFRCRKCGEYGFERAAFATEWMSVKDCPIEDRPTGTDLLS